MNVRVRLFLFLFLILLYLPFLPSGWKLIFPFISFSIDALTHNKKKLYAVYAHGSTDWMIGWSKRIWVVNFGLSLHFFSSPKYQVSCVHLLVCCYCHLEILSNNKNQILPKKCHEFPIKSFAALITWNSIVMHCIHVFSCSIHTASCDTIHLLHMYIYTHVCLLVYTIPTVRRWGCVLFLNSLYTHVYMNGLIRLCAHT